jgi:hypothetical protein
MKAILKILMIDGLCVCVVLCFGGRVVFWLYLNRQFGRFVTVFFGLMDRKKMSALIS